MRHPEPGSPAEQIVVLSGAGLSAASGLATFRDAGGTWQGARPEELATPAAWARDPARVWAFYQARRARLREVEPNAAHHALAALEARLAARGRPFLLVTQNVDDLHQRAGSRPLAMHGSLRTLRCELCGEAVDDLERLDPARFVPCPRCPHPRMRPDVVWFGELPRHLGSIAGRVACATRFLAVGTSGLVWPAAGFLELARHAGARTFVNAIEPPANLEPGDDFLPGPAVEVVPRLVEAWLGEIEGR